MQRIVIYMAMAILTCTGTARSVGQHCIQHKFGIVAALVWSKGKTFPLTPDNRAAATMVSDLHHLQLYAAQEMGLGSSITARSSLLLLGHFWECPSP